MINVARLPVTAAVAMVVAVGIALLSPSPSPTATALQLGSRHTVTENGVRFSFTVRGWGTPTKWDDWAKFSSIPTNKTPGGPISLNKSSGGGTRCRGDHLLDELPQRRLRRSVHSRAESVGWPVGRRSRGRSCDSAWHQTRQGAIGRDPGRAPSKVRVAQSSQASWLRTWLLLHLARRGRRCVVAKDGSGRHDADMDRRRGRDAPLHRSRDKRAGQPEDQERDLLDRPIDQVRLTRSPYAAVVGTRTRSRPLDATAWT